MRDERTLFERTRLMRRTRRMLAVLVAVGGLLTLSLGSALAHVAPAGGGNHAGWAAHDWSSKLALLATDEAADEDDADEAEVDETDTDEDAQGEDESEDTADEDDQGEDEQADEDEDDDEADEDDSDDDEADSDDSDDDEAEDSDSDEGDGELDD